MATSYDYDYTSYRKVKAAQGCYNKTKEINVIALQYTQEINMRLAVCSSLHRLRPSRLVRW